MLRPHRSPFESFVAPARRKSELWRLIAGICVIAGFYGARGFAVFALAPQLERATEFSTVPTNRIFLFLATFLGMAAGAIAAAQP